MFEHGRRPESNFSRIDVGARYLCLPALMAALVSACNSEAARPPGPGEPRGSAVPPATGAASSAVLHIEAGLAHGRRWLLHRDGVSVVDEESRKETARIFLTGWTWVGEADVCPPTLALGPDGEALVSSNIMPTIWRIDPTSLAATRHDLVVEEGSAREIGFSGLTYSPRQAVYFAVSGIDGSLWRIDRGLSRAAMIKLSTRMPPACGIALVPGTGRRAGAESLCVRTESGHWLVNLEAFSHSTGDAGPAQCATAPGTRAPLARGLKVDPR